MTRDRSESDLRHGLYRVSPTKNADVSSILRGLGQQGALMGAQEHEAFFVTDDVDPERAIKEGYYLLSFGITSRKPAERIIVTIQQQMQRD